MNNVNEDAKELDIFDLFNPSEDASEVEIEPKERTWSEYMKRKAQRYGIRSAESIGGIAGDVAQLARSGSQALPGGLPEEGDLNVVQKYARRGLEALPGSEELRAMSAEKFPELEPESYFEEREDEFVADAATLGLPIGGTKGKATKKLLRGIGISAIGNATKEAVKAMGAGEAGQEASKLGAMIFGGMFGKGRGVKNFIRNTYKKASDLVPSGEVFKYPTSKLSRAGKILSTGAMNDAKIEAKSFLDQIEAKTINGMMTVEDAVQFDKDIGRAVRKAGGDKAKKFNLMQVHDANRAALSEYGKQNQAWNELYTDAKMAFAGIEQSEGMKAYFRKNANLKNFTYASALLGLEEMKIPGHATMKIGSIGVIGSGYFAKEMAKRLGSNSALRRYYQNVLTASISENPAMLARNLKGLERAAKKEFEDNPIPQELMSFFEESENDKDDEE